MLASSIFISLLSLLTVINAPAQPQPVARAGSFGTIQQIIFGTYCGKCTERCAIMWCYSINPHKPVLYVDHKDSFLKQEHLTFGPKVTNEQKMELAADVIEHIPDTVLNTSIVSQRFGCPDCSDGCGIYFEIQQDGLSKKFYIDYNTSLLSGDIKTFAEYLKPIIAKMDVEEVSK